MPRAWEGEINAESPEANKEAEGLINVAIDVSLKKEAKKEHGVVEENQE